MSLSREIFLSVRIVHKHTKDGGDIAKGSAIH